MCCFDVVFFGFCFFLGFDIFVFVLSVLFEDCVGVSRICFGASLIFWVGTRGLPVFCESGCCCFFSGLLKMINQIGRRGREGGGLFFSEERGSCFFPRKEGEDVFFRGGRVERVVFCFWESLG